MQISRRDALMGAGAAAVVAGVPGAVQATQTDPVAVLVREARAYEEWLDRRNFTASDDEFNGLCGHLRELEYQIRDTPATSFEAIAGKVRIAWKGSAFSDMASDGPPAEFDKVAPLDPERFIWSALKDLERLAGEA